MAAEDMDRGCGLSIIHRWASKGTIFYMQAACMSLAVGRAPCSDSYSVEMRLDIKTRDLQKDEREGAAGEEQAER